MKYTKVVNPSSTPQTVTVEIVDPIITATGETPIPPTQDPNIAPTVSAGNSQTITLPINSAILDGSANDSDGVIKSWKWERVSGSGTIVSPTNENTQVTGLAEGISTFRLTVTDDDGASTFATTTIITKAAVVTPPPTGWALTYENGFNTKAELDPDGHNQIGGGSLSTTFFKTGPGSFLSIAEEVSNGIRSEVQFDQSRTPVYGAVEFDVYFKDYKPYGWGSSCFQMHGNNNNSANLFMYCSEGKFNVYRNPTGGSNITQSGTLKTIQPNTWYRLRFEMKWSAGTDGIFDVYIDGQLYYSFKGRTQDNNGIPYIKIGQNNWGNSKGTTMYFDNLKIYKKA